LSATAWGSAIRVWVCPWWPPNLRKRIESMRSLDHDEHAPGPQSGRAVTLGIGVFVVAVIAVLAMYAVVS
jgi:hypothetical protein